MSDSSIDSTPSQPPSKVPSWILLGFVLGAAFVLLFRLRPSPEAANVSNPGAAISAPTPVADVSAVPNPIEKRRGSALNSIEAVWAIYGDKAIWDGDTTEVALWNPETNSFRDYFEVLRRGDVVYFRSIDRLTRPIADRGLGPGLPLRFTAPATARRP